LSTAHPIAVTYAPIHAHKGDFLGDKQKPPTRWKYYHHRDRGFASTTVRIEPTEGRGGEKRAKKNSSSTTHPTAAALACNDYQRRGNPTPNALASPYNDKGDFLGRRERR